MSENHRLGTNDHEIGGDGGIKVIYQQGMFFFFGTASYHRCLEVWARKRGIESHIEERHRSSSSYLITPDDPMNGSQTKS
jgi:hypothetical protein